MTAPLRVTLVTLVRRLERAPRLLARMAAPTARMAALLARMAAPAARGGALLPAVLLILLGLTPGAGSADLAAQEPLAPVPTTRAPLPEPLDISPGGAFWRALLFPGWGHAAIGSHTRGAFYFGAQATTTYTLFRTRIRVGEAQDRVRFRESVLLQRLAAEGLDDPEAIQERFDQDATLGELRRLLDARKEQQEDLVAFGIFLLLLSGADAYVSAHLARFPDPLELEARPGPAGSGTFDVGIRLTLPNRGQAHPRR